MLKTKELETIYKNKINKTKTEIKNKQKTLIKRKEDKQNRLISFSSKKIVAI